jgi:hypothetical protein
LTAADRADIVGAMPSAHRSFALICTAFCLVIAAITTLGCGGKSAPARSTGEQIATAPAGSEQSFIAQADAVCARINTEILAVKAKGATAAEVIRVAPRTIALERNGISELAKLGPPSSLTSDWQRILGYRRTLAGELAQLLAMAKRNDGTSIKSLAAAKKHAHAGLSQVSKKSGFKACAKVGRVG